jgi:hypothetical protein
MLTVLRSEKSIDLCKRTKKMLHDDIPFVCGSKDSLNIVFALPFFLFVNYSIQEDAHPASYSL